jgi:type IV pilus assembly protein PilQ
MISSSKHSIRATLAALAASAAAYLLLPVAAAQAPGAADAVGGNSIERIDATQTGAGVFLTIQLKDSVAAVPNSFSVTNPARVALDLPGTVNNLGRNSVEINQGDLRSVNVVQAQGRARIVLNLRRPLTYSLSVKGNSVQVALGASADAPTFPAAGAAAAPDAAAATAPAPQQRVAQTPEPRSIRALDFRRGADGEGRIVVDLSDPNTTRLFQGTRKGYQGERLSLNFQNVDVRSLLQVIADFTNLNIITSDSVQGSITLRLKDVPWDQALDIILQSKGLDMRKNGNVILVAPRDELATKEKLDLEARSQIADLEPLHTENFVINYQKADDVKKLLVGDSKQSLLSKRGSVVVDVRTNQMFVQETTAHLEEIRRLLTRIDIPVPQVMIEARIVEADENFSSDIGARLGLTHVGSNQWLSSGAGASYTTGTTSTTGTNTLSVNGVTITNPNFVNLPAGALNGFSAGSLGITLFDKSVTNLLNLEVSALELDGRGKVISSPRVITADKVKASIEQGTEIPYQTVSAGGGIGQVQFRKAVLRLEVTPQITPEGAIFLDVKVNKDTPSSTVSGSAGVAIDTKNVVTQVLVENGGTVVLGGIYQQTESVTTTRIPVLGEIPYLGALFRDQVKVNNKTELIIFITPRVVSERVNQAAQ